jgi:hypothetical protein
VGMTGAVVVGVLVGVRDVGVRGVVAGGAVVELGAGIGGSGATTVSSFDEPLAITNATTKPITSNIAAPAAAHNQRGDFGDSGGGSPGPPLVGCWYCVWVQ